MYLLNFLIGIISGIFFITFLIWSKQLWWKRKLKNRKEYSLQDKYRKLFKTNIKNYRLP
jgi:hypothetical protein|tara:strand:+ start:1268 stop:1444 length:177 start_codon:yes stop_codon:yes gene_type:complete